MSTPGTTHCASSNSQVSSAMKNGINSTPSVNSSCKNKDQEEDSLETSSQILPKVNKIIKHLIDEFNCNHQADLDTNHNQVMIYNREDEHEKI